ncbi:hypothetical protein Mgra_00003210 [Meloidogyne graminicola]|uniref:Uncharacterized protein n=1 Tax=Meloidogyne graminicola TaxID=189291 RepID=A0A8S9ZVR7_9BILA|nr:hypothetical protein Mgra_00003210 [Meloidogyne graminicola]
MRHDNNISSPSPSSSATTILTNNTCTTTVFRSCTEFSHEHSKHPLASATIVSKLLIQPAHFKSNSKKFWAKLPSDSQLIYSSTSFSSSNNNNIIQTSNKQQFILPPLIVNTCSDKLLLLTKNKENNQQNSCINNNDNNKPPKKPPRIFHYQSVQFTLKFNDFYKKIFLLLS